MTANLVLASRNIFRSPKRSLSLLALMCASFLAITLIKAGYADMFADIEASFARSQGDASFSADDSGGMGLDAYRALRSELLSGGKLSAVKAVVAVQGIVGGDSASAPVSGYALEGAFDGWKGADGDVKAELGSSLAESLGLKAGDEFSGMLNGSGYSFRVEKVVTTEAKARDRFFLLMPLEALGAGESQAKVSQIMVWFANGRGRADRLALIDELTAAPGLAAYRCSAYELGNTMVNSIVRVYEDNFIVVLIVVAATMLLALANVSLLSAWERGQEWGTMLALGNRRSDIGGLIALESLALALAACAIGGILTLAVSAVANAAGGITLPPPPTATSPMRVGFKPEASAFFLACVVSILCALAASLLSAWKVGRSAVTELLFERN